MRRLSIILSLLLAAIGCVDVMAAVPLPYYNSCMSLEGMTCEPNPGRNWGVDVSDGNGIFSIRPRNSSTDHNAYIWLPAIQFENEGTYRFGIDARTLRSVPGKFELVISDKPSSNGNVTVLKPATQCYTMFGPNDCFYNCKATGEMYLGVHVISPAAADVFYIDNIWVEEVSPRVPQAVSNLKATPATGGSKKVDISFTTPSRRASGARVGALTAVSLYCDGEFAGKVDSPTANSPYTISHAPSIAGPHVYSVRAQTAEGLGGTDYVISTVGEIPEFPTYDTKNGFKYVVPAVYNDTTRKVSVSWRPRKGNETAKYDVIRMPGNVKVASAISDTTFTEDALAGPDPIAYYYTVNAVYNDSTATIGNSTVISLYSAVPFNGRFNTNNSIFEYSIYDLNNARWWFHLGSNNTASVTAADDWLVTPGVTLQPGKRYRVKVDIFSDYRPTYFSMSMGRSNHYSGLGQEIMPNSIVTSRVGEEHETYVSVDTEGQYFFGIHAQNLQDPNTFATIRLRSIEIEEVNGGIPRNVDNLHMEYDPTDVSKAKVVMNAPTLSVDDSNISKLTKIEVVADGAVIGTATDVAPGALTSIDVTVTPGEYKKLTVIPYTEAGSGVIADVEAMIIDPAYLNEFSEKESIQGFTIIDCTKDGSTWEWFNSQMRCYPEPANKPTEDWLVSPTVHLEKGKYYVASFVVTNFENAQAPTNVSMWLGTEPTVESMTTNVIKEYQPWGVGYNERALLKNYFTVDKTGNYYLGIANQCVNGLHGSPMLIDNFSISAKIAGEVPDTVTSYVITPDQDGALRGEVKFNAPTKALNGTPLEQGKKLQVNVYLDGNGVSSLQASPGEAITCPIAVEELGVHMVTVICTNEIGQGREAEDVAFFGINRPGYPSEVKVVEDPENPGTITVSWVPDPLDYDGFPMNQKHVTFEVVNITGEEETVVATGLKGTSYTFQARRPDQPQSFMRFAVRARTSFGGSPGVYAPYVAVGEPYALPLKESFANYNPRMTMVQQAIDDSSALCMWGFNSADSFGNGCYDNDNGMALMEAIFAGVHRRLVTGKIDLRNAKNPKVEMRVLRYPNRVRPTTNIIGIEVGTNTTEWDSVAYRTIEEWAEGEQGWQRMEVDLSKYIGKVIYIGIVGHAESHTFTCFDAFEVAEAKQKNLGYVAFETPESVVIGQTADYVCRVKNHGHSAAKDYTVDLYRNGEKVQSLPGVLLEPGKKTNFVFKERLDIDADGLNRYYVMINYEGDEFAFDNRTISVDVPLTVSDFPAPVGLTGSQVDGGNIGLTWTAPTIPDKSAPITDDFESYPSWNTQYTGVGKYNFLDYDGQGIAGIRGIDLPGISINSKQSWFVFDRTYSAFDTLAIADPHSGIKHMACMSLYDPQNYADDWLILPELSGEKQTISFWARSYHPNYPETFCVHWSFTGKEFSDFAQEETSSYLIWGIPAEWKKYEFEVPEGAKYFAIRRYSNGFMMFVDDLTYVPAGNERLQIEGYNVYYNGKRVNENVVTETSYKHHPDKDGAHLYSVGVQYNLGQSPLAQTEISFVGLNAIDYNSLNVKGADGYVEVAGAEGLNVAIYSADGLALYRGTASADALRVNVAPGIYAVRVAERTFKVIVR